MTKSVSNHGSAADHPSTHGTDSKDKKKDGSSDQGGSPSDLDAAVDAFGAQMMMQIFQDQQERQAEEREDDPDTA